MNLTIIILIAWKNVLTKENATCVLKSRGQRRARSFVSANLYFQISPTVTVKLMSQNVIVVSVEDMKIFRWNKFSCTYLLLFEFYTKPPTNTKHTNSFSIVHYYYISYCEYTRNLLFDLFPSNSLNSTKYFDKASW